MIELFIQTAEIDSTSITKNDPKVGITAKRNKNLILFNEGFYIGNTNNYGYWGPSYNPFKPSDIRRIALMGDSYVEGHQVFERSHFRNLLETKLNARYDIAYQVLNFGMSGFNLNDIYCNFYDFVISFNPDTTFVFITNEDFINTNSSIRRPQCNVINDSLVIDYSFSQTKEFKVRENSNWFRGKSVILGYVFNALKLYESNGLWNKFFPKWILPNESSNLNELKFDLPLRESLIVNHFLKKRQDIIFVAAKRLDQRILDLFADYPERLIVIPELDQSKYQYWKVTKMNGHWNIEGHKLIASELYKFISNN